MSRIFPYGRTKDLKNPGQPKCDSFLVRWSQDAMLCGFITSYLKTKPWLRSTDLRVSDLTDMNFSDDFARRQTFWRIDWLFRALPRGVLWCCWFPVFWAMHGGCKLTELVKWAALRNGALVAFPVQMLSLAFDLFSRVVMKSVTKTDRLEICRSSRPLANAEPLRLYSLHALCPIRLVHAIQPLRIVVPEQRPAKATSVNHFVTENNMLGEGVGGNWQWYHKLVYRGSRGAVSFLSWRIYLGSIHSETIMFGLLSLGLLFIIPGSNSIALSLVTVSRLVVPSLGLPA